MVDGTDVKWSETLGGHLNKRCVVADSQTVVVVAVVLISSWRR